MEKELVRGSFVVAWLRPGVCVPLGGLQRTLQQERSLQMRGQNTVGTKTCGCLANGYEVLPAVLAVLGRTLAKFETWPKVHRKRVHPDEKAHRDGRLQRAPLTRLRR